MIGIGGLRGALGFRALDNFKVFGFGFRVLDNFRV